MLALELHADELLIDERLGRAAAKAVGLNMVGALGVLIRAKQRGLIPAVRPLVDRLRSELNFFIAPAFYAQILRAAGE